LARIIGGEGGGKGHADDHGRATQKTVHTALLGSLLRWNIHPEGNAFDFGAFQEAGLSRVYSEHPIPSRVESRMEEVMRDVNPLKKPDTSLLTSGDAIPASLVMALGSDVAPTELIAGAPAVGVTDVLPMDASCSHGALPKLE
jgi:hypothetical protein